MTPTYVIDACALLAFLNDEPGANVLDALLQQAKSGECTLFMPKLNILEIYYGVFREDGQAKAEEVLAKILALPITVIENLSEAVFKEAGRLKAVYSISLADAIALTEAKTRNAQLVTSDHHEFDPIEKQKDVKFYWIR